MSRYLQLATSFSLPVLPRLRWPIRSCGRAGAVLDLETLPDYLKRDIGLVDGQFSPRRRAPWD
jgi:hypothetical protein